MLCGVLLVVEVGKSFMRRLVWVVGFVVSLSMMSGSLVAFAAGSELDQALRKLDASAARFKSAEADLTVDNVQTQPIEDKDTQTGTVLFQRKDGQLSMAMHLKTDNGKPVPKDAVYADGVFQLYEPLLKQVQVFKAGSNQSSVDTFLALGFGASGKDLEKNWVITYGGPEQVNGTATTKLELVPKDEGVKKNVVKVILWIDLDNGIALKQQSFDATGNYRLASYKMQHLNGSVPAGAFKLKTAPGTAVIPR